MGISFRRMGTQVTGEKIMSYDYINPTFIFLMGNVIIPITISFFVASYINKGKH